jgi:hypothetical protein
MGLEIESVEKVLWMMSGVAPLPKLTLLEAESDSLVQMRLKICSFCNDIWETEEKKGKKTYELLKK